MNSLTGFQAVAAILIVAAITFLMRAFPFLMYAGKRTPSKIVLYLGSMLPPAVIAMLVVYCFKSVSPVTFPFGIPEISATAAVVLLHLWKRNSLVSILGGTALYMFLIQVVVR